MDRPGAAVSGRTNRWATPAVRIVLFAAAMVALWAAQRGYAHFQETFALTFHWSTAAWLNWTGPAAAAGLLLGLGASPFRRGGYRWKVAVLLGVVPVLLLAHGALLFPLARHNVHVADLDRVFFFDDLGVQWALAVMVGVAVAAGFLSAPAAPGRFGAPSAPSAPAAGS